MRHILLTILFLAFALTGCGDRAKRAAKVEPDKARATLTQALDAWKAGKTPDDLKSQSPSIVAQDFDWLGGMKLSSYEVLGSGEERDANLECPVKLSLVGKDGKSVKKTVTYIVGTDPVLTVFRKMNF